MYSNETSGPQDGNLDATYVASSLERTAKKNHRPESTGTVVRILERALELREKKLRGTEYGVLHELGKNYTIILEYAKAEASFRRSVELLEKKFYPGYPLTAPILDDWVQCKLQQGKLAEAEELCQKALAIRQKSLLAQDAATLETARCLAEIQRRLGRHDEAEKLLLQCLKIVEPSTIGPVEEFYYDLALLHHDQKNYEKAEEYYRLALPIFANRAGKNARFATALKSYASLLRLIDRGEEAQKLDAEADAMLREIRARHRVLSGQNTPGLVWFDDELYAATILH